MLESRDECSNFRCFISFSKTHYREAIVGLGCHSVELNGQVATGNVEIVGRKSGLGQLDLNSGGITDVVQAVLDNSVHSLDQVLVLNLDKR